MSIHMKDEPDRKTQTVRMGIHGPLVEKVMLKIACPTCHGTGRGESCIDHGRRIFGMCADCCGYGMWWRYEE